MINSVALPVRVLRILTLAAAGMACMLALLPATGHDQLWLLYVARRVLHGTALYGPELWESNPPLIVWLSLVPAALASALHLPITLVFKSLLLVLAAGVGGLSRRLLYRLLPALSTAQLWSFGFAFAVIYGVIPARDFGQREHVLALLCLPYLLAAGAASKELDAPAVGNVSSPGVPLGMVVRVATGILAAIGFCVKPHHLLVVIGVEASLLVKALRVREGSGLRRGRVLRTLLRPELIGMAAFGLLYLGAIRLLTPNFISVMLPLLRDTYWAIGHLTWRRLVAESLQLHLLGTITLALFLMLRGRRRSGEPLGERSRLRTLGGLLLVAGCGSTLAYYIQGTGWYYQQLPALSFFGFALVCLLIEVAGRYPVLLPWWTPAAAGGVSVVALALTAYFSDYTLARPLSFPTGLSTTPDPSFFAGLPPQTPVAILTTVVDDSVPPVATHDLLWAQRQNNLWSLPGILRNQAPSAPGDPQRRIPPARLAELDEMQHAAMVEDLERWHPVLVLVARCQDPEVHCQVLEDRHDDLLAWFGRDAGFRTAFARYHYLRSSGPYDAYILK